MASGHTNTPTPSRPRPSRADRTAERRSAIVSAALAEFSEKGFASARMEDVARRAGVAKGTLYLHFEDKTALFVGIVREMIVPIADTLTEQAPEPGEPVRAYLERAVVPLAALLTAPPRADVIRLLIAEGPRFPVLAELYHREVVSRGLATVRALASLARETGELADDRLQRLPQLLIAPMILTLVWDGLFGRIEPLDGQALVSAQLDLLFGPAT